MKEIDELSQAIITLEAQRSVLGDRVVDAAQASLREKLANLAECPPTRQQRRLVSVLFLDIANSTRLSQGLEPEEVQEIIGGALKRLAGSVEAYGGQVIQFMGDGFMAVFGLKLTHENDARQAVRAGLAILAERTVCAEELEQRYHILGFDVRVGINTGRVVSGRFSEAQSPVMGLTVSLAARMEQAATPGNVLISQFTYQHVRGAFNVQALDPIVAKGFPQPVGVYRVQAARPRTFRTFTRGVEGIETRLVGREVELSQLKDTFTRAIQTREPQFVTVVGEAGVGKSRLLYEFDRWLANLGISLAVFKARMSPQMTSVPFGMLRELISYRLGLHPSDPLELTRRKLVDGLSVYFNADAEMKSHFIGALLGFDFSASPYLAGVADDPRQLHTRACLYLTQCLSTLAGQVPALIMLDDLQWADTPSVDFISTLPRECPRLPLMVICLARPNLTERFPGWGERSQITSASPPGGILPTGAQQIQLLPLSRVHSKELLSTILWNVEDLPTPLCEKILDLTEGNPFYLEEYIQSLLEARAILRLPGEAHWRLDLERLANLELPGTLVALMEARLDGLDRSARTLVMQASVIGRVFWCSALQAIRGGDPVASSEMEALARHGFIYPQEVSTFEGTQEYHFHHALLRDVAYQALVKPDRQDYHARVADWLVTTTQAGGRAGEFAPLIANHYEMAGKTDPAADWYIQAGSRARSQGDVGQACDFYDHALKFLQEDRFPSLDTPGLLRRWKALAGRDDALGMLGETRRRIEDDIALVSLAESIGDDQLVAEAYYRRGRYLGVTGQYLQELEAYTNGLAAAQRAQDLPRQTLILGLKVVCQVRLGDMEAAASTAKRVLSCANQVTDELVVARSLVNISTYYTEIGDMARAVQLLDRYLEINRRISNVGDEVAGLSNLGYAYILLGVPEDSIPLLQRCISLAGEIGSHFYGAYACLNLALAYVRQGDYNSALTITNQCLPELQEMADRFGHAIGLTYSSLAKEGLGLIPEALAGFEQSAATLKAIGTPGYLHDAIAGAARCLMAIHNVDSAYQYAVSLWDYLCQHAAAGMEFPVLAYETCADIFSANGQASLARRATGAGYGELIMRAGRISLPKWRQSFLECIPEHQRIRDRWLETINFNL
jgi:class 3 adenylate cyclase/tetratricopeptide (TPR) repeat protein